MILTYIMKNVQQILCERYIIHLNAEIISSEEICFGLYLYSC